MVQLVLMLCCCVVFLLDIASIKIVYYCVCEGRDTTESDSYPHS